MTSDQIDNLLKLPDENKKSILKSYLSRKQKRAADEESAEYYVEAVDNLISCLGKTDLVSSSPIDGLKESLSALEDLKLALRTSPLR